MMSPCGATDQRAEEAVAGHEGAVEGVPGAVGVGVPGAVGVGGPEAGGEGGHLEGEGAGAEVAGDDANQSTVLAHAFVVTP